MSSQSKSVLIVDDNFNIRAALRAFVECNMGMTVCGLASNGEEAVRQAEDQQPDLVVIDLSMPVMNGLDAARVIKAKLPDARIVIFTLFTDSLGELLAKATGVNLVVSKTEGAAGLLRALGTLLPANRDRVRQTEQPVLG